jgi:hypothetical protein
MRRMIIRSPNPSDGDVTISRRVASTPSTATALSPTVAFHADPKQSKHSTYPNTNPYPCPSWKLLPPRSRPLRGRRSISRLIHFPRRSRTWRYRPSNSMSFVATILSKITGQASQNFIDIINSTCTRVLNAAHDALSGGALKIEAAVALVHSLPANAGAYPWRAAKFLSEIIVPTWSGTNETAVRAVALKRVD